jgi:arylformamidase
MVANTGTYVDSPFHRYPHGDDLSKLRLEQLADLDTVIVRAVNVAGRALDYDVFKGLDVKGKAVLVHTGWAQHWRTDQYFEGHRYLTADAAKFLADSGAALVGIDSYNIDEVGYNSRPVHSTLLGADIPICEHMVGLDQLPDRGVRFFAVPVKVAGFGTFPVRAFAIAQE